MYHTLSSDTQLYILKLHLDDFDAHFMMWTFGAALSDAIPEHQCQFLRLTADCTSVIN